MTMLVKVTKQSHEQKITHWMDITYPIQLTEVQAKIISIGTVLNKKQKRAFLVISGMYRWLDELYDDRTLLRSRHERLQQLLEAIEQCPDGVLVDYHLVEDIL